MADSTVLLILGAMGDLSKRLLLPGVGSLLKHEPQRRLRIIGADRAEGAEESFLAQLASSLEEGGASPELVAEQSAHATYHPLDVTDAQAFDALLRTFDDDAQVIIYFALPPSVTRAACIALLSCTLPTNTHLAMEKPFGHDLASARELNRIATRLVPGDRIHRVDHFLGKSTVLNVMALRFANRLFSPVWTAENIESVDIAYDEALALEGRAEYYDHAGALVDMIQSHLLQVLSVVAMEPPSQISDRELRDAKSAVLRATRLWGDDVAAATRRGRYLAGEIAGREVPAYVDEPGVDPSRATETMAQVTVEVVNQRWAGVPFTLRSGKALSQTDKRIVVTFKDVHHLPEGLHGTAAKDQLVIGLDPDVMELHLTTNRAEDAFTLEQSVFSTDLRVSQLEAYGEVLAAILDGEAFLSVGAGAAEECWRIVDQVLDGWRSGASPMQEYPAGSAVPQEWLTRA